MTDTQLLVQETKDSLINYIPRLMNACEDIVEAQQTGQDSWVGLFDALMEGVAWVASAIDGIQSVGGGDLAGIEIGRLTTLLSQTQGALSNQDFVLFGDLLQYELKSLLEEFGNEIARS